MSNLKRYVGVKLIEAEPMTRQAYNDFRGWTLPADEDGADKGYLVRYQNAYVSWSPEAVFNASHRPVTGMTFGHAIEVLKAGGRVARSGWNGKNMFLRFVHPAWPHPDNFGEAADMVSHINPYFKLADNNRYAEGTMLPWIGLKTADNGFVPWHASQTDMLAEDWEIVVRVLN